MTGSGLVRVLFLGVTVLAVAACAGPKQYIVYAERFCYRTLAEVDCHSEPLPNEAFREVGWFDQPFLVEVEE